MQWWRILRVIVRVVAAIVMAGVLVIAAPARAVAAPAIEDLVTGLVLDLGPSGADVCVIVPRSARIAEGCAGIDADALGARVARALPQASAAALLRLPGRMIVVSVSAEPTRTPLRTREQIEEYLTAARKGWAALGVSPK